MPYFEFDPFEFDADRRKKQSRELIKKLFEYKLKTDKDFARRVREINQNSSQTSSKEFYSRIQKLLESTLQKK
jgi:hypothetical protein